MIRDPGGFGAAQAGPLSRTAATQVKLLRETEPLSRSVVTAARPSRPVVSTAPPCRLATTIATR